MTPAERTALAGQVRREEKLAKAALKTRSKELLALMEQELAAVYKAEDEAWAQIVEEAERMVEEADARIAAICEQRGIPPDFRPSLHLSWFGRGANASQARRAELRRVGASKIAALEQQAALEIERWSVKMQRALLAGGLKTAAARAFLESLPQAEDLMPPLRIEDLEAEVPKQLPRGFLS